MPGPSFEEVANFVQHLTGVRNGYPISGETRLETDLGVTGDDGSALLDEASKRFSAAVTSDIDGYRTTFALAPNEDLFSEEGLDLLGICLLVRWLRKELRSIVRDLTIAQLHDAILRTRSAPTGLDPAFVDTPRFVLEDHCPRCGPRNRHVEAWRSRTSQCL